MSSAPSEDSSRPSDDALMSLVCQGDRRAFELLVRRHEAAIRRYLGRMVGPAEAADLCQETLVSIWEMRSRYRAEGRFVALMYRVARSKAISHLRWRRVREVFAVAEARRHGHVPPTDQGAAPDPAALERLLASERDRALSARVSSLPTAMRDAVVLHYVEGLDYATISEITGAAEVTLRSRAHRGLALLAQQLGKGQS
ncbi:MAG: RNA polymerase sigma factor [Myxococcota bacterium]